MTKRHERVIYKPGAIQILPFQVMLIHSAHSEALTLSKRRNTP